MAKNKSRKNNPQSQAAASQKQASVQAESAVKSESRSKKHKDLLYQVQSKRDSGVIKAFITFNYRVLHPGVTPRLLLYGLIVALPGVFFFKDLYWRLFFIIVGLAMILLGLFRQYISLWITKRNDADYKSGAIFTYNFYETDAEFLKNDSRFSGLDRYKDITNFYYDKSYYYLGVRGREFYVIPKSGFTQGDADDFEEFIYKKSKHTCRWIPDNFKDRMQKRRAERAVASGNLLK